IVNHSKHVSLTFDTRSYPNKKINDLAEFIAQEEIDRNNGC
ncbi:unnamed protein product, partial [Rotaria sp. Silwood1]